MIKTITIEDIEGVVGFKVSEHCKGLINKFNLQYTEPTQQERDDIILDIINALNTELETAGKHKLEKWEKGWYENFEL